jgi:hypothetical protein
MVGSIVYGDVSDDQLLAPECLPVIGHPSSGRSNIAAVPVVHREVIEAVASQSEQLVNAMGRLLPDEDDPDSEPSLTCSWII